MNPTKNILIISTQIFSSGAWTYYPLEILNSLNKANGFNIHFLYNSQNSSDEHYIPININKIPIKAPKQRIFRRLFNLFPITIFRKISKLNKKYNFHCVHIISPDFILTNFMRILRNKYKLIYTVHDLHMHPSENLRISYWNRYRLWNFKRNIYLCKNLVSCSNSQIKEMKILFPDKNIFFHHMPSLIPKFVENGNDDIQELRDIKGYILFFGTILPYKGIDVLYEAYLESGLKNEIPLVVAGHSFNYNPFSKCKKSPNLIFVSRKIKDSEIRNLFLRAKCVVCPYTSITMSAAVQYPYCFGIPVIASDLPYFKDEIIDGKTGLLFKTGDCHDLSQKMKYICDANFDSEKMKEEQLKLYKQICSRDNLRRELECIYNSVLQGEGV